MMPSIFQVVEVMWCRCRCRWRASRTTRSLTLVPWPVDARKSLVRQWRKTVQVQPRDHCNPSQSPSTSGSRSSLLASTAPSSSGVLPPFPSLSIVFNVPPQGMSEYYGVPRSQSPPCPLNDRLGTSPLFPSPFASSLQNSHSFHLARPLILPSPVPQQLAKSHLAAASFPPSFPLCLPWALKPHPLLRYHE